MLLSLFVTTVSAWYFENVLLYISSHLCILWQHVDSFKLAMVGVLANAAIFFFLRVSQLLNIYQHTTVHSPRKQ